MESDTKKINWDTYVEDGKHPCEGCIGCEHSNKVWGGVLCVAIIKYLLSKQNQYWL